jgi:multicomponent K+:H+ antiporter subunit D
MTAASLILPIAVPAMTAAFLVLALRHSLNAQRVASVIATAAQLAVAAGLFALANEGAPQAYFLGNWPAPFGIVLVLDRLAATMLLLTAVLATGVVIAALGKWDRRGRHFHALFQFQLLGINGAFLTGDLFNLFVFFEVLLIASYGLMLHGGGALRLKAGFHYVAINLIGSTVFLFAIGTLYAVTGTLNMADLAVKIPQVPEPNQALLGAGAFLLMTVFAIKSAMVPLHWWLPATYGTTSAPAAAIFAIMTKVGAYSIIRVSTLIFGANTGPLADAFAPWILGAGIVTAVFGTVGMLANRTLTELVCYALIASMGTLLIAIGLDSPAGLAAALYYAAQSTLVTAGLFLLAGVLGKEQDDHEPLARPTLLFAALYFLLAIGMAGMPPLAGFIGKLLILDAARANAHAVAVWAVILVSSLLAIVGFARRGMTVFWTDGEEPPDSQPPPFPLPQVLAISGMIVATALLSVYAGSVMQSFAATADQLFAPDAYVRAVLEPASPTGPQGGAP